MMREKVLRTVVLATALLLAGCAGNAGNNAGNEDAPVTVGLLTSLSGSASAAFVGAESGLQARLDAYMDEGGKCSGLRFDTVTADDQSSPQGALTATQKLIQQDSVFAIAEVSPYFFGAARYATTTGKATPIVGAAIDSAPQWLQDDNNLFPAAAAVPDYSKTFTTLGDYWKSVGITKIAGVSYDNESSAASLEQMLRSADAAGIKRAYVTDTLPMGSTDVGPIVLGIKNSGAQALYLPINPDTSMAIVAGLRQAGVELKSIVSSTGYGADLLQSAPAVQAAQGMTFLTPVAPVELKTPATELMSTALKKYAASPSGIPSFSQTFGWLAGDLIVHGLELNDCSTSQADFQTVLRGDKSWDAGGLIPAAVNFSSPDHSRECQYLVDLDGNQFSPVENASPVCGRLVSNH